MLLYGPDHGLVRARAEAVAASVADPSDPFSASDLSPALIRADPARLLDEAAMLTFSGARRVVRVRDASDGLAPTVERYLDARQGDALVVLEGGELSKKSPLRGLFEKHKDAAAVACYPEEGAGLLQRVEDTVRHAGLGIQGEALELLVAHLGSDHGVTQAELGKLILYKGEAGTVSVEDVQACVTDSAAISLDDAVQAACSGDAAALDRALQRVLAETQPVTVIRGAGRHVQRLLLAGGLMAAGHSPDKAMDALRPPVFRRDRASFRRQMQAWPVERLARACEILVQAELDCKTTGLPAGAICQRALMRIAQAAASGRHEMVRR